MYIEELISIGRTENGFVLEVRVPYDRDDSDDCCCPCPSSEMKQFSIKTAEEVGAKVAEILPKLKDEMNAEDVFKQIIKETS